MEKPNKQLPLVTIFGRTNVGKSTLFNRLTEKRQAITSNIECTTRDSNRDTIEWQGVTMELIDTGGIMDEKIERTIKNLPTKKTEATIERAVQKQALELLKQSDVILFVTDNKTGPLPQDQLLASFLKRRYLKKTLLVVNKVDHPKHRLETVAFHKIGMAEPNCVSAFTGSGTGDLLDQVVNKIPVKYKKKEITIAPEIEKIKVCIIGKPNVGKSSLINSLLDDNRVIVSELPHTTREPQNTDMVYQDKNITLIDTAGISRKGTKTKGLEKYGINKSLQALKKSDIALLVIDIFEGITHQDAKLVEEVFDREKSLIIVANKWDKIEEKDTKKTTQYIYDKFPYATWAPIQLVSAKTGSKVKKIFDLLLEVAIQRKKELSQSQLDKFLSRVVKIHSPAKAKGIRPPYIYKINQIKANPPVFTVKIRTKDTLHFSYIRFIKNKLREKFGFLGTPIKIEILHGAEKEVNLKKK